MEALTEDQITSIRNFPRFGELTDINETSDTLHRIMYHVWGPERLCLFRTMIFKVPESMRDEKADLNRALYRGDLEAKAKQVCPELLAQLEEEEAAARAEAERIEHLSVSELVSEFTDVLDKYAKSGTEIVLL